MGERAQPVAHQGLPRLRARGPPRGGEARPGQLTHLGCLDGGKGASLASSGCTRPSRAAACSTQLWCCGAAAAGACVHVHHLHTGAPRSNSAAVTEPRRLRGAVEASGGARAAAAHQQKRLLLRRGAGRCAVAPLLWVAPWRWEVAANGHPVWQCRRRRQRGGGRQGDPQPPPRQRAAPHCPHCTCSSLSTACPAMARAKAALRQLVWQAVALAAVTALVLVLLTPNLRCALAGMWPRHGFATGCCGSDKRRCLPTAAITCSRQTMRVLLCARRPAAAACRCLVQAAGHCHLTARKHAAAAAEAA